MFHFVGHHFAYFVVGGGSAFFGYLVGAVIKSTVMRDYELVKAKLAAFEATK